MANVSEPISLGTSGILDAKMGPFASVAEALSAIPLFSRSKGQIVMIDPGGASSAVPYIFRDGTENSDLVPLTTPGLSASSDEVITGNWTFQGDVFIQGETIEIDSQVVTTDRVLVLNDGEVGPGVTAGHSGLLILRGSLKPFWIGFDEERNVPTAGFVDLLNAWQIAQTNILAYREDNPADGTIASWDETNGRLKFLPATEFQSIKNLQDTIDHGVKNSPGANGSFTWENVEIDSSRITEKSGKLTFSTVPADGIVETLRRFGLGKSGGQNNPSIFFSNDINTGIYLQTEGSLGITTGGTSRAIFNSIGLSVTGNVEATDFIIPSDISLKSNIRPVDINGIYNLSGYYFDWKDDGKQDIGVIAQEVEKYYPELVYNHAGVKRVSYQKLVPVLIEAIKSQNLRIKELENAITK